MAPRGSRGDIGRGTSSKERGAGATSTSSSSDATSAFQLFYEMSFRQVATADLRDQLVLTLKDYRRFLDPEMMAAIVQLFHTVWRRSVLCFVREEGTAKKGEYFFRTSTTMNMNAPSGGSATTTSGERKERERAERQRRREQDRYRRREGSARFVAEEDFEEQDPKYKHDTLLWNLSCWLVWRSGCAQSERLLLPLRGWQARSAANGDLFGQMKDVQKFMEELGEAIGSLKNEVVCEEEYYAVGWRGVFEQEGGSPGSARGEGNLRGGGTREKLLGAAPKLPASSEQSSAAQLPLSAHIVVDAIRQQVRDLLHWVAGTTPGHGERTPGAPTAARAGARPPVERCSGRWMGWRKHAKNLNRI